MVVREVVSRLFRRRITERLDAVYRADDTDSALDSELQAIQVRSLPTESSYGLQSNGCTKAPG